MARSDSTPDAGRFLRWALWLVAPMVLAALALPWVMERVGHPGRGALALPGALPPGLTRPAGDEPAAERPRPPDHPTIEQIEASRKATVEAGRVQQKGLDGATVYAPRDVKVVGGERVAPFQGFGVSVESVPPGASVLVDGRDVGETPILTSVRCEPGSQVEVRVERPGYTPWRRGVRCRSDALVELEARLVR